MPVYNLTSVKTGKVYPVNFDSTPSESDVDEAISHFDIQSKGIERRASVEPQLAQQEALRQQNVEGYLGVLPGYGSPSAYKAGVQAGRDIGGTGIIGDVLGGVTGVGAVLGTLFNPITKAASNIPRLTQAEAERLGALSTGDLNAELAKQTATGEREVQPLINFGDTTSTAANLGASLLNTIQTEPVNAALALEGGIKGVTNLRGTIKGIARPIEAGVNYLTPSIVKRVGGGVKDVVTRKEVGTLAQDVFSPKGDTAKIDLNKDIQSGVLHDDLRNIEQFGKPKTAEQMLENGLIAKDNLINIHNDFASQFPNERFSNSDISASLRQDATAKELSTPQEKNAVLNVADQIDGERSLEGSFKLLQELNDRRSAYYEKSSKGQATDLDNARNEAEQIARDQLSEKLGNFYKLKTGATDNPYQQYGSLSGRLSDLTLRLNDLLTKRGIEVSKGLSLDREVLSTIKKNVSLLTGGELARIDSRVAKMFKSLGKEDVTNLRDLTPEEQASLQQERSVEQANISKNQAADARAKRGVEYKKVNETRAEFAKRIKQKRADLLAREGASPEELQQGGAAAETLSQMEKDFQSKIEAKGLNGALMDVFPEVNKSERTIIDRELQSASPAEARDIMNQLLNEQFHIGERGSMKRISSEFDKVLRKIRKERESQISKSID